MDDILCEQCEGIKEQHKFTCIVCQRLMAYHNCNNCNQKIENIFDVCSPKCKQIVNGEAHIIPINYNHKSLLVIEDFDEYMGLKVVDHTLLQQVLSYEQKENLNQKCKECREGTYNLLPYKCWSCKDVYTYEVSCNKCYNKNGYLCDECDYQING
jgi:hypothetical protein